jgi:hypothetical protein
MRRRLRRRSRQPSVERNRILRRLSPIVALLMVHLVASSGCRTRQESQRTYSSPDGVYTVHLAGYFSPLFNPLMRAWVRVAIDKNGSPFADLGEVHSADSFDAAFDQVYTSLSWTGNRVFRMTGAPRERLSDQIVVNNESGITLNAISVAAADTVVAVEIPVHTSVAIPAMSMSGGGSVTIRVNAQWANGKAFHQSVDLPVTTDHREHNVIAITVKDRLYIGSSIRTER